MATKPPKTVRGVAQQQKRQEAALLKSMGRAPTTDSFVNFQQQLGIGADNALSSSGYGFNPVTRVRTLLEWIHRGSWLGGVAIDLLADDMTRGGVDIISELPPDKLEQIEEAVTTLAIWDRINDTIKWARLYGGCLGVYLIDGQNPSSQLRMETVGRGQFRGLMVLDRWMVEPSLNDLVTEPGPDLGLPKFYRVNSDAPGFSGMRIHYSRCFRLEGVRLPYWQRVMENLWGISVLERLYDRMVGYDSASTGAAQLIYKAYIRVMSLENMRDLVAAGGPALGGLSAYVNMMRRFQGIEGITLIDAKDKMEALSYTFAGIGDLLGQLGQQIAGALQIPLVRLFGQSPSGFSTGDTDLRMYYDSVRQRQQQQLKVPVTTIYRLTAQSEGIKVPDGFRIDFRSLWQITDKEKAEIATTVVDAVIKANEAGLISDQVSMKELQASSKVTGVFTNISDEDIEKADDEAVPAAEAAMDLMQEQGGEGGAPPAAGGAGGKGGKGKQVAALEKTSLPKPKKGKGAGKDAASESSSVNVAANMQRMHGLDVVVETEKGAVRTGRDWQVTMPCDYGYIRRTVGADGDQVDCFIGPDHDAKDVFIIHQMKNSNLAQFDEHKVMLGYAGLDAALADYIASFSDARGWDLVGNIERLRVDELKNWLEQFKGSPV